MLARVQALRFRSLLFTDQRLAGFHLLVGPNGSGKSNFLDVIAFLRDFLAGGLEAAITGDLGRSIRQRASDPSQLVWQREPRRFELAVEIVLPDSLTGRYRMPFERARYEVAIRPGTAHQATRIDAETLWLLSGSSGAAHRQPKLFPEPPIAPPSIFREPSRRTPAGWRPVVKKIAESGNDYFRSETSDWNNQFRLGPSKSALANLPEDEVRFPAATWAKKVLLEGVQHVVLNAEAIRSPSPPGSPSVFLVDGSNLPFVVESLRSKSRDKFNSWLAHLQTAIPDIVDIRTVERQEDRHRYLIVRYSSGYEAPSWVVSDGTLRLLALTLLAYLGSVERVVLVEEPENGIHPRAVETVYESLSSVYGSQVLCASHSPVMLSLAKPSELLCFAKDASGATDIISGDNHPALRTWQGSIDLGTLFAAGILG